jgi:hypothetical protein
VIAPHQHRPRTSRSAVTIYASTFISATQPQPPCTPAGGTPGASGPYTAVPAGRRYYGCGGRNSLGGRAGGGPSTLPSRPKFAQYQSYRQSNGTTGPATGSFPRTPPCPQTVTPPASTHSAATADGATTTTSEAATVVNPKTKQRCLNHTATLIVGTLGLTPDGGHLTGGTAGPAGRMSVCRASVASTPRSFGSRLPAW